MELFWHIQLAHRSPDKPAVVAGATQDALTNTHLKQVQRGRAYVLTSTYDSKYRCHLCRCSAQILALPRHTQIRQRRREKQKKEHQIADKDKYPLYCELRDPTIFHFDCLS